MGLPDRSVPEAPPGLSVQWLPRGRWRLRAQPIPWSLPRLEAQWRLPHLLHLCPR